MSIWVHFLWKSVTYCVSQVPSTSWKKHVFPGNCTPFRNSLSVPWNTITWICIDTQNTNKAITYVFQGVNIVYLCKKSCLSRSPWDDLGIWCLFCALSLIEIWKGSWRWDCRGKHSFLIHNISPSSVQFPTVDQRVFVPEILLFFSLCIRSVICILKGLISLSVYFLPLGPIIVLVSQCFLHQMIIHPLCAPSRVLFCV